MPVSDRYSLDRHDKKLAGVCSTLGQIFNIDPTFIRIAWVAVPLLTPVDFTTAVIAYVIAGVYLHIRKLRAARRAEPRSEFERMADVGRTRASVHDMRTKLDANDRRMMAIDHHLSSQNDELAREIEALRQEK